MKNYGWIVSMIFIIIAFAAGALITTYKYERINQEANSDYDDAITFDSVFEEDAISETISPKETAESITPELVWRNKYGIIGDKTVEITDEGEALYYTTVTLEELGETIDLDISKTEHKILQENDEVMVHYIYNETDKTLDYANFIRDKNGQLEIVNDKPTVVLDAGHGGRDDGQGSNDMWLEKDFVLKMTLLMKEYLEESGIRVILTRAEDENVYLYDRCAISNYANADLFISNHLNKINGDVSGSEVYYSMKSDAALANDIADAIALSGIDNFKVSTRPDPNYPYIDYYSVHKYVDAQSYIVEYGFADNEEDAAIINENWETMVEDVSEVIIDYCFQELE